MVRDVSRRGTSGISELEGGLGGARDGNNMLHSTVPARSAYKQDTDPPSTGFTAIAHLHGRERGPWGGGKVWLDMGLRHSLTSNVPTRCRLLLARRSWASTRLLGAPIREDFFPSSYRYRGHEGCVNAIRFHPTEPWLCSGGDDLRILIWEPRVWPRTPKAAIRTEHSDNIFCIDFDTLGGHALTAANDGLVTRIDLGSSPTSETRDFHSLYRRLQIPSVEEMRTLSLPLTHPDATPDAPPAALLPAPAAVARNSLDALAAAQEDLIFFPRGRIRACFEAKFVDTAGQIAAAALELGFVALSDFRERPEVTHPVMRDSGDFTSVDPHLPLPFQLAYAGSCGAGILDLRTARPLMRLRVPAVLGRAPEDETKKHRGRSSSNARRRRRSNSSNSSESDLYTRAPTIEEHLEFIRRLRQRVTYRRRGDGRDSTSPEMTGEAGAAAVATPLRRSSSMSSRSSSHDRSASRNSNRNSSRSRPRDGTDTEEGVAPTSPGRGKRRCIRSSARQQSETEGSSQSRSSSNNSCAAMTDSAGHSSRVVPPDLVPRTRLQHAAAASSASRGSPQRQQPIRRQRARQAEQQRRVERTREELEQVLRAEHREPRTAAAAVAAPVRRLGARSRRQGSRSAGASPTDASEAEAAGGFSGVSRRHPAARRAAAESAPGDPTPAAEPARQPCRRRGRRNRAAHRPPSAASEGPPLADSRQTRGESPVRTAATEGRRSRQRRARRSELRGVPSAAAPDGEEEEAERVTSTAAASDPPRGGAGRESSGREEPRDRRQEPQRSEAVREALRQAEAIAARLPPIRFPTYRAVARGTGGRQPCPARDIADVPLVEMVDKIVFSWDGRLLLAIRRRKEPLIYSTDWELPLFELLSEGYINFNTMKGGCFLTDGRHVACGSENLQVHLWRLPSPLPHKPAATQSLNRIGLLHGHLCVVNCCASPAPQSPLGLWGPPMLATSGVEKMVRVWSCETPRDKDDCDEYALDGRLHEDSEAPVYRVWFSERYEFGDDDGSVGDLANEIYEDLGASGSSG